MADDLHDARTELAKVDRAGPLDDAVRLLNDRENTVKQVRTGGALGGGVKSHATARKEYFELQGKPA